MDESLRDSFFSIASRFYGEIGADRTQCVIFTVYG